MDENIRVPPNDEAGHIVRARFEDFLKTFDLPVQESDHGLQGLLNNYMHQLLYMVQCNKSTLYVDFQHVQQADLELAEAIEVEFYRFEPYLRHALQNVVAQEHKDYVQDADRSQREFFVSFYHLPQLLSICQLRSQRVGRLVSVVGTVTRTSDVRPELFYAHFICNKCGTVYPHVEQQLTYCEPPQCKNSSCAKRDFLLVKERSVFVDFQRIRLQENAEHIPAGSMPRCLDVVCRNEAVEGAKAGDRVLLTGCLSVLPDAQGAGRTGESAVSAKSASYQDGVGGLKALGVRELTYKLLFCACTVQLCEASPALRTRSNLSNILPYFLDPASLSPLEGSRGVFSESELGEVQRMHNTSQLYTRLAESICPSVFGHLEIKRGILLMLLGGVHKVTKEGISLRGDINVCIVGDPSCAKSQFLKYVHSFLPHSVYTSGKSSSAAGLTASIVRDPETGEFAVEAGALLRADNNICCIDEFDKMDAADQVAIHEAMEQQTISITKAGIQATLNARTAILAAANPLYGRYDRSKPLKANINISAAIMSRFDLFFIVLDEVSAQLDRQISRHIIEVHRGEGVREKEQQAPFSQEQLQRYIMYARTLNPVMTPASYQVLVDCYRLLRSNDLLGKNKTAYRITVRQLESLVRLSEALARLHLDEEVQEVYVREAYRLLQRSIIFIEAEDVNLEEGEEQAAEEGGGEAISLERGALEGGDENFHPPFNVAQEQVEGPRGAGEERGAEGRGGKKVAVSARAYDEISSLLCLRLKSMEEEHEEEGDFGGCSWGELRDWYLSSHREQGKEGLAQGEEGAERRKLLNQIIRRMVKRDGSLVVVNVNEQDNEQKILRLSPSYQS